MAATTDDIDSDDDDAIIGVMVQRIISYHFIELMMPAAAAKERAKLLWTMYKADKLTPGSNAHTEIVVHERTAREMLDGIRQAGIRFVTANDILTVSINSNGKADSDV